MSKVKVLTWVKDLGAGAELREALDIDSMDFLNFIAALYKRLGVTVPEADYPKLSTIDAAVDYLAARIPAATG